MADDHWREPPDDRLLIPVTWLLRQTMTTRIVVLAGYWSLLAIAGAFLGFAPLSGILGSFLLLGIALGLYAALVAVRRRQWEDAGHEALWMVLGWLLTAATLVAVVLVVLVPMIVFLALAAWAAVRLPLMLLSP